MRRFYCALLNIALVPTSPQAMRRILKERYGGLLSRVFEGSVWEVDHFVPKRWGGKDHPCNYVLMTREENRAHASYITASKTSSLCPSCVKSISDFAKGVKTGSRTLCPTCKAACFGFPETSSN